MNLARTLILTALVMTMVLGAAARAAADDADPNLPKGGGIVILAPNAFKATAVAYAYQAGSIPFALTIGFPGAPRGMVYLGFNAEGTWMYDRDEVYLLKGKTLRRASVNSVAEVPNGLKNPSPQYLADHAGSAAGGEVPVSTGQYAEDPNLPNARGEITLRANPYNIKKLTYHYPAGPKAAPLVETGVPAVTTQSFLKYVGYNDEGTWFFDGYLLKGDRLLKLNLGAAIGSMLTLKNPAPEVLRHFPAPSVVYRNLYGSDPNLKAAIGIITLDRNTADAIALSYVFLSTESGPRVTLHFADKDQAATYLGYNEQGTWLQAERIYVLNSKQLTLAAATTLAGTPNNLQDGSERYCKAHNLVYTPHRAPLAKEIKIAANDDGSATIYYMLETLQSNSLEPILTPMKFLVRRPSVNASAPPGLPPIVLKHCNVGAWVWIGDGAAAGKAGLFYFDMSSGSDGSVPSAADSGGACPREANSELVNGDYLVWFFITPQQAAQYLGR